MVWFAYASEASWILAQCFLTWRLIDSIAEERFRHGITVSVWVVASLVMAGIEIWNITTTGVASSAGLTAYSVLLGLIGCVLYKTRFICSTQLSVMIWEFGRLWDYLIQTVIYSVLKFDYPYPRIFQDLGIYRGVVLIIYSGLTIFVAFKLGSLVKRYLRGTWILKWRGLFFSIAFWFILTILQRIYYDQSDLVNENYYFIWHLLIMGVVIAIVVFWVVNRKIMLQKENQLQRQQNEFVERKYLQLWDQYQERRQLVHDSKNSFLTLRHYIENQELTKAEEYLNELLPMQETSGVYRWSGHEVLDMILSTKAEQAKEAGIECRIFSDQMNGLKLTDVEVSSLFGNLLDNAIEAQADKQSLHEKWIEVSIKKIQDTLYLNVRNPYEGEVKFVDGKPVTTKEDKENHGVGTRVVEKYVDIYNGALRYRTENQIFSVEIIMNAFDAD